jgi:hypothetical protein
MFFVNVMSLCLRSMKSAVKPVNRSAAKPKTSSYKGVKPYASSTQLGDVGDFDVQPSLPPLSSPARAGGVLVSRELLVGVWARVLVELVIIVPPWDFPLLG